MAGSDDGVEKLSKLRFIQDEPAAIDLFQTHTRIASALAQTIRSNPRTRVIGLVGKWGSGKSTVLRYMEQKLIEGEPKGEIHVLSYDAWLHQHDPVRRSFLEALIEYLIEHGYTDREKWSEKLAELRGQAETSTVTSTPSFAPGGKSIVLSLLLVPVGLALVDFDAVESAVGKGETFGWGTLLLAFALLLAPIALFARRWWQTKNKQELDHVLSIFMNRSVEKTVTNTRRDPEPSAIEFRRLFRAVMDDASASGRRFVFVIDNLDRVDEQEALQIWATIRGFFVSPDGQRGPSTESGQPIVVLPIDKHALLRLFRSSEDDADLMLTSFLDKTFDLAFEVPPPVMSDWRSYLGCKMTEATGFEANSQPVYWLRRFFEDKVSASPDTITPREINKLVNRVVALALQWQDESVALESICFYAVHGVDAADGGLIQLLAGEDGRAVPPASQWQREVAALHYGVSPDKAAQVLLEQPLGRAIAEADVTKFNSLTAIAGFDEAFERYLVGLPQQLKGDNSDFRVITNISVLLDRSSGIGALVESQSWCDLVKLYIRASDSVFEYPDFDTRVSSFFRHVEADFVADFVNATARKIALQISQDRTGAQLDIILRAAADLVKYAKSNGLPAPFFQVGPDASRFLDRLLTAQRHQSAVWRHLRWAGARSDMEAVLVAMLDNPSQYAHVPSLVEILSSADGQHLFTEPTTWAWPSLVEAATSSARETRSDDPASPSALETLGVLLSLNIGSKVVAALVAEGHVASRVSECVAAEDYAQAARVTALLVWAGGDFAPPGKPWEDIFRACPDFVQITHAALVRYTQNVTIYTVWNCSATAPSAFPLVGRIIRHQVEIGNLGRLHLETVLKDPNKYLAPVPHRLQPKLVSNLSKYMGFWDKLSTVEDDGSFVQWLRLAARKNSPLAKTAESVWRRRIDQVPLERWQPALEHGQQPYELLTEYVRRADRGFDKSSSICAALTAFAPMLLRAPVEVRRRWFALLKTLTPAAAKAALHSARAAIATGAPVEDLLGLLKMSKGAIAEGGSMAAFASGAISHIVLPATQTKPGRAWLEANHAEVRKWIARGDTAARSALEKRLAALRRSKRTETRYWAEMISQRWKQ